MKRMYVFIDDLINSKKVYICFLLCLIGSVLSALNVSGLYNNFFANIYEALHGNWFLMLLFIACSINMLNIVNYTDKQYCVKLRLKNGKFISFVKKEIIISTLYIIIISFILLISFSILFSTGDYSVIYINTKNVLLYDIWIIINVILFMVFISLIFYDLSKIYGDKIVDVTIVIISILNVISIFKYNTVNINGLSNFYCGFNYLFYDCIYNPYWLELVVSVIFYLILLIIYVILNKKLKEEK